MLSSSCVLCFIDNHDIVLRQRTSNGKSCRKGCVASRTSLQTFQLCKSFGNVKNRPLSYSHITIKIPEHSGRIARHIGAIRPNCKRNSKSCMPCGKRLSVEIPVGCHVQPLEIHACTYYLGIRTFCLQNTSGSPGSYASAGMSANYVIWILTSKLSNLFHYLCTQSLYASNRKGGIQGGIKIACLFQHQEEHIK